MLIANQTPIIETEVLCVLYRYIILSLKYLLIEIKSDMEKVDNDEAKIAIEDKANEYYNSYKTAALDNPTVVKKVSHRSLLSPQRKGCCKVSFCPEPYIHSASS